MALTAATVTYWRGRGRCEPLRVVLACGGVRFVGNYLEKKADMDALKASGKLEYDQVPLVEADGLNLVQGTPTAVYLAQGCGLWPEMPKEQYICGHILAATQDARGPLVSFPFHLDEQRCLEELQSPKGLLGRFAPRWEALLGEGKPYFLGATPSLADCAVYEVLDFVRHVYGEERLKALFGAFPLLLAHHDRVLGLGHMREWRDVGRKEAFLDWPEYAASVRATLGF